MTLRSSPVPHSPDDVLAALTAKEPNRLLGIGESPQVDFKGAPYDLRSELGKWELGKDVAGMANHLPGVLVLGVRTKKTPGNFEELADKLAPIPAEMLDKEQYHAIIRDIVRPAVEFTIGFHPDPDEQGRGYMTISVQPVAEHDRWALVRRMITDEGKLADGVGVPIRDGDQTRWLSAEEVYQLIRDGKRASAQGGTPGGAPAAAGESAGTLDQEAAASRLIGFKDWDDPVLIWQSAPVTRVDLTARMWGDDGIAKELRTFPRIRGNGFGWRILGDAVPFEDGALLSDGRQAIWMQDNGLLTAAALADENMLAWSRRPSAASPYRLDLFALTEMTLEYFRLADEVVTPRAGSPYRHAIETRGFAGEPGVTLSLALPGAIGGEQYPVRKDRRFAFQSTGEAGRDSYEALSRLFGVFALGADKVRFARDGRIDGGALLEYVRTHR